MTIRVLLVDDDASIRAVLVRFLTKEGFSVDSSESGPAGLERLRMASYDVLLSDLVMPGMSGLDLVAAAKSTDPRLRCILMSGLERPAIPTDDVDWLDKPIDIETLLALLPSSGAGAPA